MINGSNECSVSNQKVNNNDSTDYSPSIGKDYCNHLWITHQRQ